MNNKENRFNELYAQSKSRNFVLHLIRAYTPTNKVVKYWGNYNGDKPKDEKLRCAVCGQPLASIEEIWSKTVATPGVMEAQMKYSFDAILNPDAHKDDERSDVPIVKAIDGKVQAFTGDKTETKMCLSCIQDLVSFTQNMILRGDKQINFAIKKEMAKQFPDALPVIEDIQKQQKADYERRKKERLEREKLEAERISAKSNKLGDFMSEDALAKLKNLHKD